MNNLILYFYNFDLKKSFQHDHSDYASSKTAIPFPDILESKLIFRTNLFYLIYLIIQLKEEKKLKIREMKFFHENFLFSF